MSDVRATTGVPVAANFGGVATPSACAPLIVDTANGVIYSLKTGDVVVEGVANQGTRDVSITDATKGFVLKDTQATPHYWRISVSNTGVLSTADIGTTAP